MSNCLFLSEIIYLTIPVQFFKGCFEDAWMYVMYTVISINVVGSKLQAKRQDRKVVWVVLNLSSEARQKMKSNKPFLELNDFVSEKRKCLLQQNMILFQYTHRVQFLTVSFRVLQALPP